MISDEQLEDITKLYEELVDMSCVTLNLKVTSLLITAAKGIGTLLEGYRFRSDRIVELPCKVSQTAYVPWKFSVAQGIASAEIKEIKIYDSQNHWMFLIDLESDDECFNKAYGGWKSEQAIGMSVFLSKEEAEEALTKMKSEDWYVLQ